MPRVGLEHTEVREIEVDCDQPHDDEFLRESIERFFSRRGLGEALYDLEVDDNGYFAVVNDEAYQQSWGTSLF
ncbi:MAG: hypothetical protein SF069_19170 [Phycisphaerae bacterium]|nr:hypothetical protein [Phycisphaerae bacterium]